MAVIEEYKMMLKALLSPSERKQLQTVLTQFVQDKSFTNLRITLPVVLNTPQKRQMCQYIRRLMPDKYLAEYDGVVAALPPLEGEPPRPAPLPPPRDPPPPPPRASLSGAASPEDPLIHTYVNWGALDNLDTVKSLEFTDHDALLYENCRQLLDDTRSRVSGSSGSAAVSRHGSASTPLSRSSTGESLRRPAAAWPRESYMVGNITRQHSESLLQQHGGTDGLFLVRSKDGDLCHVVSVVYKGAPLHLLVERATHEEPFKVNGETFGQCYTIQDIVERMRAFGPRFEYQLIRPLFS